MGMLLAYHVTIAPYQTNSDSSQSDVPLTMEELVLKHCRLFEFFFSIISLYLGTNSTAFEQVGTIPNSILNFESR